MEKSALCVALFVSFTSGVAEMYKLLNSQISETLKLQKNLQWRSFLCLTALLYRDLEDQPKFWKDFEKNFEK